MIPRETKIEQSVSDHLRDHLVALGYTPDRLAIREAFPGLAERSTPLAKNTLAIGFDFDDGGRPVELGSDLTQRIYTMEFWTFGVSIAHARTIAATVKSIFEINPVVPLKDVGVEGQPVIDQIVVLDDVKRIIVQRQISTEPAAWDQFVYTTTVKFEDYYSPSAE